MGPDVRSPTFNSVKVMDLFKNYYNLPSPSFQNKRKFFLPPKREEDNYNMKTQTINLVL